MANPTDKTQTKPTRIKLINSVVSKTLYIIIGIGRLTNVIFLITHIRDLSFYCFFDSLNRRSRQDCLDDLFDYPLNYTNHPLLKWQAQANINSSLYAFPILYQKEELVTLRMRLGMLIETSIMIMCFFQVRRHHIHRKSRKVFLTFLGVQKNQAYPLVIIKLRSDLVDSPKIRNCHVTMVHTILTLTYIA